MKKITATVCALAVFFAFAFSGCELLGGSSGNAKNFDREFAPSTGKWLFLNDEYEPTDTYFVFNGESGAMTFDYFENGVKKLGGTYRVVASADKGKDRTYVFMWCLDKKDGEKEDVLTCYSDDFSTEQGSEFMQFTIMQSEKKLPMVEGNLYSHTYRLNEQPYKTGTYVREGYSFKQEKDEYKYADTYQIPSGTYALDENTSFTFFMTKPRPYVLFRYRNGDTEINGVYWTGDKRKSIYLYVQHDPYQKVTKKDKEIYDTTFDMYYPPDFSVYGDFDVTAENSEIVFDRITVNSNAPDYGQSFWRTGTYRSVGNQ